MADILESDDYDWVIRVIPKLKEHLGSRYKDAEYKLSLPTNALYVSELVYVSIVNGPPNEKPETLNLVAKRPLLDETMREKLRCDAQFHNEILFYQKYADDLDVPRSVYLVESPTSDTIIILENVKDRGYQVCPWKYDVPSKYTLAAVREIARFHGKGYVTKERQRDKFLDVVGDIRETRYDDRPENLFTEVCDMHAFTAVQYLRDQGRDSKFCDSLEKYLKKSFENVMLKCTETSEPLATLCHGDFTLSNTLFREENGQLKAMLIDYALMRYGTPAIDLSTYLCLCSAGDLTRERTEKILRVYHDSLRDYLREHGIDDAIYSYEAILDDYRRKGLFGYVIASFFLRMLMQNGSTPPPEVKVMKRLGEMLANLIDFGCLRDVSLDN